MNKFLLLSASSVVLSGCFATGLDFGILKQPQSWENASESALVEQSELTSWWKSFDDQTLNQLVEIGMADSPDRLVAEARILEARGTRRSVRSFLFPQIGASGSVGREDNAMNPIDGYHDARFDASYEIDVFGKNRKNLNAADAQIQELQESYHDVSLTLIAEISRVYINLRTFQKQSEIAHKNVTIQQKTLDLIRQQRKFGEAPQLDVERAENLVNTTKASIPEFDRLAENARLQLGVLTGKLPEELSPILANAQNVPMGSEQPILMTPAQVLSLRPDIRAANANLIENTALAESVTAELFPTFSISGFFGVTENALINTASIWNIAAGAAVSILDFGRIEGRIDAARAREMQAFQAYRKTVLQAVADVETALVDFSNIKKQTASLQKAYDNADRALGLSETLYREGEVSFLDVLDSQRTVNSAESALIDAQAAQAESLVRLYKALGVY